MTIDTNLLKFPYKPASATAGVLARFLSGDRLPSLDAVSGASTTRLAAVEHYLGHAYGWAITSQDKAAPCCDGRVAWVSEYYLPVEFIEKAEAIGAVGWCAGVHAARAAHRDNAGEAVHRARQANDRSDRGIGG
jgi:hypothetical protein